MPSTYSTNLRLENLGNGEQVGTWGDTTDNNICTLLEQAISGVVSAAMTDANYTLSALNGVSDEARAMVIELTGALTATRNVVCPTADKLYFIYNNTSGGQSIVFKTTAGSGITIANGKKHLVYCDATNVVDAVTELASGTTVGGSVVVTETGTQTLTNKTLTAPVITGLDIADNQFLIKDNSDTSKKIAFEASGIATATTRTLTAPDANTTIVGTDATQVLTNKTFRDSTLTVSDESDTTKTFQFQASGISTATNRTYTMPNGDMALGARVRNAQTGTTYTVLLTDRRKHITTSNASAVAVTLPIASTTGFGDGFSFLIENIGAGVATVTPTTSTINLGTALVLRQYEWAEVTGDGTNYRTITSGQITGAPLDREIGTRGIPQNVQDAAYPIVMSDAGGHIYKNSASARTWTIPANSSVAFPIGTAITLINGSGAGAVTVAITTDTLRKGDGTDATGSRTIASNSVCTIIKVASTLWYITGVYT